MVTTSGRLGGRRMILRHQAKAMLRLSSIQTEEDSKRHELDMKVWQYGSAGQPKTVLGLVEVEDPVTSATRPIIVEVQAVSLNPDSCVLMRMLPNWLLRRSPRIPEIDFSGRVTEDSDLRGTHYKVGDAVYGHIPPVAHVSKNIGALATRIAVSPRWTLLRPPRFGYCEAAALPTSFVAACKLAAMVHDGARVFINGGSGGIGLTLIQILKHAKGAHVTSTASEKSWAVVQKQRPDAIVDYKKTGHLASYLRDNSRPFDYCIDLIGDRKLFRSSRFFLAENGSFIAFGGGLGNTSLFGFFRWFLVTLLLGKLPWWLGGPGRTFHFVTVRKEEDTVTGLRELEKASTEGWLEPCIDSCFAFEDARQAYERVLSRGADGKVVIEVIASPG